jgi:hypothetical protein
MYGMGSSFESGGKRWRVSVFGYPRECVDDFLLQAQWRPCELLAQQRHRETMKGFIRQLVLPDPVLPQKMAMLGDFHTMPFSVTAGTAWSFFSLFSMCGTNVLVLI